MESGELPSPLHKEIFKTDSSVYEEVFQWGDDEVTVQCDPQDILRNIARNIPSENKEKIQKPVDIQFFFDAKGLKDELKKIRNRQRPMQSCES